jgi:hypothetical protein
MSRRTLLVAASSAAALTYGCAFAVTPPAGAPPPGLSAALVAQMLAAFDRDARELRVDALAGALAPDAAILLRTRALGEPREMRPTAAAYVESARATLTDLRRDGVRYVLAAGEPSIAVDPAGAWATSTSESTETYEFPDGRRLVTVNRAVLRFEWREGRAVVVAIEQDDLTPPPPAASP